MNFTDIQSIQSAGFTGFKTIKQLRTEKTIIPKTNGVYLILNPHMDCSFLEIGTGGFFKGRNPNVDVELLRENWIENSPIVYIGKATSLHKRLGQYFRFGEGKNVGHWGGRFIWQMANSCDLIVCWKETKENPREVEKLLIQEYIGHYGKRPFANLVS